VQRTAASSTKSSEPLQTSNPKNGANPARSNGMRCATSFRRQNRSGQTTDTRSTPLISSYVHLEVGMDGFFTDPGIGNAARDTFVEKTKKKD
jgi:hypothetical protein